MNAELIAAIDACRRTADDFAVTTGEAIVDAGMTGRDALDRHFPGEAAHIAATYAIDVQWVRERLIAACTHAVQRRTARGARLFRTND